MPTTSRQIRFAICLTAHSDEDLQIGKVYRVLPDAKAAEVACLRVIDDSGEDYLYAANRFVVVKLPEKARGRLLKVVKASSGRELAGARSPEAHG
jgi:hypothetical protein